TDNVLIRLWWRPQRVIDLGVMWSQPQLEKKPYATPFAAGDMGDGYHWTGTPHESSSTRDRGYVRSDAVTLPTNEGAALFRFTRPDDASDRVLYMCSLGKISGSDTNLTIRRTSGNELQLRDGNDYKLAPTSTTGAGETVAVYMVWTASTVSVDWG